MAVGLFSIVLQNNFSFLMRLFHHPVSTFQTNLLYSVKEFPEYTEKYFKLHTKIVQMDSISTLFFFIIANECDSLS